MIDRTPAILIKPAGSTIFFQPPLQGMKAAVFVPLTLLWRAHNFQPLQPRRYQDASYLKRKDDHAVVFSLTAFPALQAVKSDLSYLSGQLCWGERFRCQKNIIQLRNPIFSIFLLHMGRLFHSSLAQGDEII
jgi:hypothetical protein